MKNALSSRALALFAPAVTAIIVLAAGLAWTFPCAAGSAGDIASVVRGGRLYDNWFLELRDIAPETVHPAFPHQAGAPSRPGESWRCQACHGWDYRGRHGVGGIGGISAKADSDPVLVIAILKDDRHRYGDLMSEEDFRDLAAFVVRGQVDMEAIIDRRTKRARGWFPRRSGLYATICAQCHGLDGIGVPSMGPLGTFARERPWETLHKILNGHPRERMPAMRALGLDALAGLLAHAQSLPSDDLLASVARGGRLYDNWMKETGRKAPAFRHPAYPVAGRYAASPAVNWRCKECHGWDYKGREGNYGNGTHVTGIKGISRLAGKDPQGILAYLMDETHAMKWQDWFEGYLNERDFRDLANFISQGQIDMDRHIDRATGTVKGDPARHAAHFKTICASCHGSEGKTLITGHQVGRLARSNPWEVLHKIRNGHPGEAMPAMIALDLQTMIDILAYAQTLPE